MNNPELYITETLEKKNEYKNNLWLKFCMIFITWMHAIKQWNNWEFFFMYKNKYSRQSSSSELSIQSFLPSQRQDFKIHRPFLHWKSSPEHLLPKTNVYENTSYTCWFLVKVRFKTYDDSSIRMELFSLNLILQMNIFFIDFTNIFNVM